MGATPSQTRLRVINLIPNATFLTLTLDNDAPVVTGLGFQQTTGYIQVTGGTREFKVSVDSNPTNIIDVSDTIIIGSDNTYVVSGPVEATNSVLLIDTQLFVPNGGTFDIRMLNVASGSVSVDLYLTPPGTDLTATGPTVAGVTFGNVSAFTAVTTGSYEIRATPSGTKEVIYDTGVISFGDKTFSGGDYLRHGQQQARRRRSAQHRQQRDRAGLSEPRSPSSSCSTRPRSAR